MEYTNSSGCLTCKLEEHHCRKHVPEDQQWHKLTRFVLLGGCLDEVKH